MGVGSKDGRRNLVWWAALIAAVFLALSINPVGFAGGGLDDWQYLNAARCWREFGPCLPHDHWQSRWPVIAPLALFTSLFGENRITVEIAPLLATFVCLLMLSVIGNRALGKPIGWIAALLLLATPAFTTQALDPSPEAFELAMILGGGYATSRWIEDGGALWGFLAGLSLSLAIQVRETALTAAIFVAAYAIYRRRPSPASFAAAAASFAAPFIAEFATFKILTGDPFWRLHLAIQHTQLRSSELLGPIDTSHSPFFNKSYIAHWKLIPGVHVHWAIDGALNLFLNAFAGISLALVPILIFARGRRLAQRERWNAISLWIGAFLYCCVLIYAFAIDPKPRMFMPALAASNMALALITFSFWQNGSRTLAGAVWATIGLVGITYVFGYVRTNSIDRTARLWMREFPAQIETDDNTRKVLALVKGSEQLPIVGSGHSMLLYESAKPCRDWIREAHLELFVVGEARRSRLSRLGPDFQRSLCLFRYQSVRARQGIKRVIHRAYPNSAWTSLPRIEG